MELYIGIGLVVFLVVGTIIERLKGRQEKLKPGTSTGEEWELNEFHSGRRSFYDVFEEGRNLDCHEQNHLEGVQLGRACQLAEQRRSGRWSGKSVTVHWTPGKTEEGDACARWLERHGESVGVHVRVKH